MIIAKLAKVAAVVVLTSMAAASVPAAVLVPTGDTAYNPATPGLGAGSTSIFSTTANFNSSSFLGFLTSTVWNEPTNPNGLTFTYQFSLTSGPHAASQLTVTSFGDLWVDAGYSTDGSAVPVVKPTLATRSSDGDVIRFGFFSPDVSPGNMSALLIVRTSSSVWSHSDAALINGQAVNVASLAPMPIPEPGSLSLLALGLGMLAFFRRQR